MDEALKKHLSLVAAKIRRLALEGVYCAKSGHPGGSLSIADILAYLYFKELHVDSKNPDWSDRDRFVLSKGHGAPALYATLALKGYFSEEELKHLRSVGHILQGHPNMNETPGVDMSTGSLGQGISAACGMALSAKLYNKNYRVYSILGDGELEEGEVWEAAMFAAHYKLDNLCAFIDFNGLQIDGRVDSVMSPMPIAGKFEQFGWHTVEINAHDFDEIEVALQKARSAKGRPTAIVAHSVKGKGVSFMQNVAEWHGSAPDSEQYKIAAGELEAVIAKLEV